MPTYAYLCLELLSAPLRLRLVRLRSAIASYRQRQPENESLVETYPVNLSRELIPLLCGRHVDRGEVTRWIRPKIQQLTFIYGVYDQLSS